MKLGSTPEIVARRARVIAAVARKPGTAAEVARTARRTDVDLVQDDLTALRKKGLLMRDGKPAVWSLP